MHPPSSTNTALASHMHSINRLTTTALLLLASITACPARADADFNGWQNLVQMQRDSMANEQIGLMLRQQHMQHMLGNAASAPGTTAASRSAPTDVPAQLAQAYPPAARADARKLFAALLEKYHHAVEDRFGIARNDLSGAFATFLVACVEASTGKDADAGAFEAVVMQMRTFFAPRVAAAKLSPRDLQQAYEQFAIIGMMLSETQTGLKQHHDEEVARATRSAAKGYLAEFLKVDPERISLAKTGLVIQ